jgi:uncharacterized protein (DUF1330 family)
MVAYVVVYRESTTDRAPMAEYLSRARAISDEHGLTIRALNGRHDVREGAPIEAVSILEFPSYEAAQLWYDDPRYQEALAFRKQTGAFHCIIIDGV